MTLKRLFCVLMTLLLLPLSLSGCASEAEAAVGKLESRYAALEAFSARVRARVSLSDRAQDYLLDWSYDGGASRVTVVEPEELAGISIHTAENGELRFSYEEVTLAVEPTASAISPLEALVEMLADWRGSVPEAYAFELYGEENALAVDFGHMRGTQVFSQRAWFDPVTLAPRAAEIYTDGAMLAVFTFTEFTEG